MLLDVNIPVILIAAVIATVSPGPATLALAGTSMASGRAAGLVLASGITTGSLVWSVTAALGLGALMLANAWVFELIRYLGAAYLMYLAYKAARSALSDKELSTTSFGGKYVGKYVGKISSIYVKGLALHLTNPKAILFFGSLYSLGVPPGTGILDLLLVVVIVGIQSFVIFHVYALLFSSSGVTRVYLRMRRWFESIFALGFGMASIKILTTRAPSS